MKYRLLIIFLFVFEGISLAQNKSDLWKNTIKQNNMVALDSRMQLPENKLFKLNLVGLKSNLKNAPSRTLSKKQSVIVLSIPNANGVLEKFSIYENSIMEPALAARYPEIKSYIGIGVDNPLATAYFSVSPLGFKSMTLSPDKSAVFIEPISADLETYTVYTKADKELSLTPFECSVIEEVKPQIEEVLLRPNADDALLRTYRLAMSCTGEFTTYFGGTKALALAAINNSITRCNGVFERDFGATLIIIANTDLVIYTNASTDPYASTTSSSSWNSQLQSTLTSVIGESNYDIGHLFAYGIGGGNAGCIGCVCVNNSKGSGYTSTSGPPSGDTFDIDYVAHEIGHQMGANHTFSHSNEGTGANMEPGSGSTIMGYAGITNQDVQPNSDAYFHAISIQQVTDNIKAKTCSVNTVTGNAIPTANAGLDYIIPKSTPFVLTGSGTDANGDTLTYNWEQFDNAAASATGASSVASATRTTGPTFRSYNSSTSPLRYFPRMTSVLAGATTTAGTEITVEALPSVARTLNFRLTVRDNRPGGPANNSDDMVVTVDAVAGPFIVTSPNTAISYAIGTTQNVTWDTAGTTANGVNCANVDILISANGGSTWSTLVSATPNDGNQAITLPSTTGTTYRIMVKGTNHIFFDVSNTNFSIINAPAAPTISSISTTSVCSGNTFTVTGTNLSTTNAVSIGGIPVASYVINSNTQITLTAGNETTGSVSVTTAGGSVTSSASITINPLPTTSWAASTNTACQSTSARTATLAYTATTNTPATYSISWSASPTNSFTPVTNQSFSGTVGGGTITINIPANTNAGTYTGTITVRNANGCISAATQTFTVTINPIPTGVTATASPTNLCIGSTINLNSSVAVASVNNTNLSTINVSRSTGTSYTSIFPATSITTWRNSANTDDNLSNNQPIGFNFVYNGTSYSSFRVSTNGFVTFDDTSTANGAGASPAAYSYTNNWTTASSGLIVAANWDDLSTSGNLNTVTDLNNSINYSTAGNIGQRILTVEWKNMKDFSSTSTASYNWQIKFYEIDNHIEFVYGTMTQSATSVSYSLGLSAATVSVTPSVNQLLSQSTANTGTFGFTNTNNLAIIPTSNTTISFNTVNPVYSWTGPNFFASSAANPTITSATAAASGVYNLVISNPLTGCQSNQALTAAVTVNERPTAAISGTTTICNGGSSSISITVTGSGTISGTLSPGAIPFSGTAPTISINITPTSNTTYSIATLTDATCTSIASDLTGTRTINVNSNTSSTTTQTQCDGSYVWSGPLGNGQTYTVSNNTATFVSGCNTQSLNLTINQSTSSSQSVTACSTYTWSVNNVTYTSSGTYTVNGTNASGCPDTKILVLTINPCESVVNIKMNIQGYYDTTTHEMRPVLANQGVGSSSTNVDNVTVELHDDAAPYAIVASTSAMLQRNGSIRATFFPSAVGRFYIVVKHRNSLETWSATAQTVGATELTYDFTDSASKAFGSNMIFIDGKYAIYNGDINQDGFIESGDYPSLYNDSDAGFEGFFTTDLNGDGFVESADYPILFNNSDSGIESIHP